MIVYVVMSYRFDEVDNHFEVITFDDFTKAHGYSAEWNYKLPKFIHYVKSKVIE